VEENVGTGAGPEEFVPDGAVEAFFKAAGRGEAGLSDPE